MGCRDEKNCETERTGADFLEEIGMDEKLAGIIAKAARAARIAAERIAAATALSEWEKGIRGCRDQVDTERKMQP